MSDIIMFSDLLVEARGRKTRCQLSRCSGLSLTSIQNWEGYQVVDIVLPNEDILPKIAKAYKVDLTTLRKAWIHSREIRDIETRVSANLGKHDKTIPECNFAGSIGKFRSLSRTNPQLGRLRAGRA